MFKIGKILGFFMKKFKLVALCGAMGFLGSVQGFGMDEESQENKPSITVVTPSGEAFDVDTKENFGYVGNYAKVFFSKFHSSVTYQFTSIQENFDLELSNCDGELNLFLGARKSVSISLSNTPNFNGVITLGKYVADLTVAPDASSFESVKQILQGNLPESLKTITLKGGCFDASKVQELNLSSKYTLRINPPNE